MKKIICLLLLAACIFSLTGCVPFFPIGTIISGVVAELNPDYEAEDAVFYLNDLSIVLTDAFYVSDEYEDGIWLDSANGTSVLVEMYEFGASDYEAGYSLSEYADQLMDNVKESNDGTASNFSEITVDGDLAYFTYDVRIIFSFKYFEAVYKSDSAMYNVCFMCDANKYDTYEEHFIRWARSAQIDRSNAVAMLPGEYAEAEI